MESAGYDEDGLLAVAREAAESSYSPYSHFRVGAAAVCEDGSVHTGTNIENANFSLTLHGEHLAMAKAAVSGGGRIVAVAISCPEGDPGRPETLMPCGSCRQVMAELCDAETVFIIDKVGSFSLAELLPMPFILEL